MPMLGYATWHLVTRVCSSAELGSHVVDESRAPEPRGGQHAGRADEGPGAEPSQGVRMARLEIIDAGEAGREQAGAPATFCGSDAFAAAQRFGSRRERAVKRRRDRPLLRIEVG